MRELEEILAQLDDDDIDVDHLAAQVRRAAALIALCRGRLGAARIEVTRIVADLDALTATDLTAAPADDSDGDGDGDEEVGVDGEDGAGNGDDEVDRRPGALPLDDLEGAEG